MGTPLLFLTGTLCSERLFAGLSSTARERSRIHVPGSAPGVSTSVEEAEYLLAELTEPAILVGFSLGGLVALEMAAQRPDLVAGLALVCAGAGVDDNAGRARRLALLEAARRHGPAYIVASELWPSYGALDRPDLLPVLVEMAEECGIETFERQTSIALSRADSRPRLARIKVPVLLVSGEHDGLCPPTRHREMAQTVPHAKVECVAGCGHLVPLEAPDRLSMSLVPILCEGIGGGAALTRPRNRS